MKKRWIKGISFLLVLSLLLGSLLFSFADDAPGEDYETGPTIDEMMNDPVFLEEQSQFLADYFEITDDQIEKYKEIFDGWIAEGSLYLDENGYLVATEEFISSFDEDMWLTIDGMIRYMNEMIDAGVVEFEIIETFQAYALTNRDTNTAPEITVQVKVQPFSEFIQNEAAMTQVSKAASELMEETLSQNTQASISTYSDSIDLPFGNIVNQNKILIRDLFSTSLAYMNPNSAFTFVVMNWISLVRTGGDWDYKQPRLYGTAQKYNCYLGPRNNYYTAMMTGENMGNYNYGYTGYLLFPQFVLIAGSVAVAGFSIKKDKHDWPDIKNGYRDSGTVGYK